MRKLLLIGLVIAVCMLAFPQGVMAASVPITVNANLGNYIEFTAAGPSVDWELNYLNVPDPFVNTLSNAISFYGESNVPWRVTVEGDHNGKFTDPGSGASFSLTNPLKISNDDIGEVYVDTYPGTTIATGNAGSFSEMSRNLQQTLTAADLPSNNYSIILTIDCTAS